MRPVRRAKVAGPPGNWVRSPKKSTSTPALPPMLRSHRRHTTWLALSARSTARAGARPDGDDLHAETTPERHEPLEELGRLQGLDDDGHREAQLDEPHAGPFPAAEVGQGQDAAPTGGDGAVRCGRRPPRTSRHRSRRTTCPAGAGPPPSTGRRTRRPDRPGPPEPDRRARVRTPAADGGRPWPAATPFPEPARRRDRPCRRSTAPGRRAAAGWPGRRPSRRGPGARTLEQPAHGRFAVARGTVGGERAAGARGRRGFGLGGGQGGRDPSGPAVVLTAAQRPGVSAAPSTPSLVLLEVCRRSCQRTRPLGRVPSGEAVAERVAGAGAVGLSPRPPALGHRDRLINRLGGRRLARLAPDLDEALDRRDRGEDQHDPQQREPASR